MSNPRWLAMLNWQTASDDDRAAWFRRMARAYFDRANGHAMALYNMPHPGVHDYQIDAIERFLAHAANDDDAAVEQATRLVYAGSGSDRGLIADNVLWHRAFGPRVRATLLKRTMCHGRSGSILVINAQSIGCVVDYFREVEAEHLMDADELDALNGFPDLVEVFRGAKRKPGHLRRTAYALSWTQNYPTATWFGQRGRGDGEGVVLRALIPRDSILANWSKSGAEPEIVVEPRRLRKVEIVECVKPAALAA